MLELNKIYNMDCIEGMKLIPDNSIDSIVTDPPYEIGFMGKWWDSTGIANNVDMRKECLRVLKPWWHLLSFAATRTYHRMACAIEDAGFEVRDMIEWVYWSWFPKSLNIGKVTDKFLKTGNASWNGTGDSSNGALGYSKLQHKQDYRPEDYSNRHQNKEEITEEQAKQWEGWGTALKPAHEPICMARKPLAEKTVAENCLKWGTGGINIDESRVEHNEELKVGFMKTNREKGLNSTSYGGEKDNRTEDWTSTQGRFPANLIHDNSEEVRECFPETKTGKAIRSNSGGKTFGGENTKPVMEDLGYDDNGGNASRFFKSIIYQAKASKSERNKGCEELEESVRVRQGLAGEHKDTISKNNHPTVKPIALMEYLIKMVTREWWTVLDPFTWSWTTLVAAKRNLYNYIWFELSKEYCDIIEARLKSVQVWLF